MEEQQHRSDREEPVREGLEADDVLDGSAPVPMPAAWSEPVEREVPLWRDGHVSYPGMFEPGLPGPFPGLPAQVPDDPAYSPGSGVPGYGPSGYGEPGYMSPPSSPAAPWAPYGTAGMLPGLFGSAAPGGMTSDPVSGTGGLPGFTVPGTGGLPMGLPGQSGGYPGAGYTEWMGFPGGTGAPTPPMAPGLPGTAAGMPGGGIPGIPGMPFPGPGSGLGLFPPVGLPGGAAGMPGGPGGAPGSWGFPPLETGWFSREPLGYLEQYPIPGAPPAEVEHEGPGSPQSSEPGPPADAPEDGTT
ncbi:MAG: hypothetical protein QJR01_01760 [Kyrpidia sp.]|nr:hypothetical protein [Kyrpidia sp.]